MIRVLSGAIGIAMVVAACASDSSSPSAPSTTAAAIPTVETSPSKAAAAPTASPASYAGVGFVTVAPDGRLYTTDCGIGVVVEVTSSTTARLVAGSLGGFVEEARPSGGPEGLRFGDGGPATAASLVCPAGLAFDPDGRLLIADHGHNRVRRVDADGTIETIVGAASPPYVNAGAFTGDGGPAVDASLDAPVGLTVDATGRLLIADRENDRVRVVTPDGIIETIAGNGDGTFDGDGGPATGASLDYPLSTAVDASGNVFIADDNHNRVRVVRSDGRIETVIGDGTFASGGDGGPAAKAQVNDPQGVVLDAAGNLYVAEYGGNRIRRIDPDGIVTTIAGTGEATTKAPDGPALTTPLNQPGLLVIGPDGDIYTNDQQNGWIVRIDPAAGTVTTVGGGPQGLLVE